MPHVAKVKGPPILKLVPFVYGFDNITITAITNAGDERLFVTIREGKIWIVNPAGQILPTPFLDIKDRVRYQDNFEQGLLGLAFHPDYPRTPYYYIVYTVYDAIVVARGVVKPTSPNTADPLDLQVFIVIRKPDIPGDPSPGPSPVHNGGDLVFGKDGYLYIPLGDGAPILTVCRGREILIIIRSDGTRCWVAFCASIPIQSWPETGLRAGQPLLDPT